MQHSAFVITLRLSPTSYIPTNQNCCKFGATFAYKHNYKLGVLINYTYDFSKIKMIQLFKGCMEIQKSLIKQNRKLARMAFAQSYRKYDSLNFPKSKVYTLYLILDTFVYEKAHLKCAQFSFTAPKITTQVHSIQFNPLIQRKSARCYPKPLPSGPRLTDTQTMANWDTTSSLAPPINQLIEFLALN